MVPRRVDEQHRVSTPLELLFDLTFVVAVSLLARELGHGVAEDHPGHAVSAFLMVFFAIWWAWMNFTWFASAYDTDDVPYRLLTLLQMGGVLVLAAGVAPAFENKGYTAVTIGYVVMRVAMLAQWGRAARSDPGRRTTALRYVIGTAAVQAAWLVRLALPASAAVASFLVLVVAELAVPWWAERGSEQSTWHPHHIAERYGLFVIIVLGECVLAATTAVQVAVADGGVSAKLLVVAAGGLILLFGLWWVYFLRPAGEGLERRREVAFWWGYGHYGVFAGLAAIGAGLEVTTEAVTHHIAAPDTLVAAAVGVPVAVVLLLVWFLHRPLGTVTRGDGVVFVAAALVTLVLVAAAGALGLPAVTLLMAVPVAAVVTVGIRHRSS